MSLPGPIIVVSNDKQPKLTAALDDANLFPIVESTWADASRAVAQMQPAAVLVAMSEVSQAELLLLARQVGTSQPYLPLIAVDPGSSLPENVIPFSHAGRSSDRLAARLRAALRVRSLHATVMRRVEDQAMACPTIAETEPVRDATVLLVGRGGGYPALSVALGGRMGIVGAFSIEAAAKHLNMRDIDGIVLGEGFSPRVVDAFLTVLGEDPRFRNLPVVVTLDGWAPTYDLSNLEIIVGDPAHVAANAFPLIRQHAFEAHMRRMLRSIDAGGLLDPLTGLLTKQAFKRDFATAVRETLSRGGDLSIARFAFDPTHPRAHLDGARLTRRLMRQTDFGAVHEGGSVIVVFADTDLRNAHAIARRLSSVMRHTDHGKRDARRSEPTVTLATLEASDTAQSLLARLCEEGRRAAS
jgi:GGDEF domain-containing protein